MFFIIEPKCKQNDYTVDVYKTKNCEFVSNLKLDKILLKFLVESWILLRVMEVDVHRAGSYIRLA